MADGPKKPSPAVSRRGLFGILTKGFADARDTAKEELARPRDGANPASPGPTPAGSPIRKGGGPRFATRNRPSSETVAGKADAAGRVTADLTAAPLAIGGSVRIDVPGLPLPLVLVRVTDRHHTACTGACPEDASDLLWSGPQDVLWCPSCGSRWRLDGSLMRGPATGTLVSWNALVLEGVARLSR